MLGSFTQICGFLTPSGLLGNYYENYAYFEFIVLSIMKNFKNSILIKYIHDVTSNNFNLSGSKLLKKSMI